MSGNATYQVLALLRQIRRLATGSFAVTNADLTPLVFKLVRGLRAHIG